MKTFGAILAMLGVLAIAGTAGASDCGNIEFNQILLQSIAGFALLGIGSTCMRIGERLEDLRYEQEYEDA